MQAARIFQITTQMEKLMKHLNKKMLCLAAALAVLTVLTACQPAQPPRPDQEGSQNPQTTTQPEDETVNQPDVPTTPPAEETNTPGPSVQGSTEPAAYKGKIVSILGDSISAFKGYIPQADGFNLAHQSRYPESFVDGVDDMWWMKVIETLDAKLGVNDSWRGTEVINNISGNNGIVGVKTSMVSQTRIQNLGGNGTPDIILFYGGTNDIIMGESIGMFNPAYARKKADLTTTQWLTVSECYAETILRLRHFYPDAHVIAILPAETTSYTRDRLDIYNNLFIKICEHYNVPYVDLRESGISTQKDMSDGIHPNPSGMQIIADAVLDTIYASCPVLPGEATLYSVTHKLSHVTASTSFCKKITAGTSFSGTLTGENLTVKVTMGGKDVTAECYADGTIHIPAVTGDVSVTASGKAFSPYAEYLQQPGAVCSGTNLWAILPHSSKYYVNGGWETYGTKLRSITIPISEGDRIWATSFGPSSTNGSGSTSGIRVTFFSEYDVINSLGAAAVYNEVKANGYLVAPKGAVAVNVPMWTDSPQSAVYILNREHNYLNGVCTICDGAETGAK